jgi:hypothetical protein
MKTKGMNISVIITQRLQLVVDIPLKSRREQNHEISYENHENKPCKLTKEVQKSQADIVDKVLFVVAFTKL